jgi:uncharacterized protein involved in exopolysaccharide biosynthesis
LTPGVPNADGNRGYTFRSFVSRLLESLFSRPFLTSLPIVAFGALGILSVSSTRDDYVSTGVLSVSKSTLLGDLTNVGASDAFSWETQATLTSRDINELLGTNEFATDVADKAGIVPAIESGVLGLSTIRSSIVAYPTGTNLVTIRVATDNPELSFRLASATIESFTQWVIDGEIAESTVAEAFFAGRLETYEADLNDARTALSEFEESGSNDAIELGRLTSDLELATSQYGTALAKSEEAKLSTETATSTITQRLQVLDVPQMPFAPESSRKAMIMTIATYIIVGLLFATAFVAAGAVLDRSVRYVGDVQSRLNLDVLAVVPAVRR